MQWLSLSTRRPFSYRDHSDSLLRKLVSMLLIWALVMTSLPSYGSVALAASGKASTVGVATPSLIMPDAFSHEIAKGHAPDRAIIRNKRPKKVSEPAHFQLASLRTPVNRSSATAVLQSSVPGSSSIASNFNGTGIPAGDSIWFSSVFKASGLGSQPVRIFLRSASVQFTAAANTYKLPVPDATITLSPTATSATTAYDPSRNEWITSVPSSGLAGNTLLSGMTLAVPAGGLPGGINPVTWSGTFYSDTAGVSINWQWAAAVYTSFGTDYRTLQVKPVDDNSASLYKNSDHAGTPEAYKSFVTGGARGGGGSNYTGSYSATTSIVPVNHVPNYPPVANAGPN